jgi:F0F1-type ATP synthase epsilon subunit
MLDCRTVSIVLPAHDGLLGIWYNHMPMLCELGLGIMEVRGIASEDKPLPADTFLLVDGGFAIISSNIVTIVVDDALTIQDIQAEKHERILKDTLARPVGESYSLQQKQHDIERNAFIVKLSQMAVSSAH